MEWNGKMNENDVLERAYFGVTIPDFACWGWGNSRKTSARPPSRESKTRSTEYETGVQKWDVWSNVLTLILSVLGTIWRKCVTVGTHTHTHTRTLHLLLLKHRLIIEENTRYIFIFHWHCSAHLEKSTAFLVEAVNRCTSFSHVACLLSRYTQRVVNWPNIG
jgi:hypothetical protein